MYVYMDMYMYGTVFAEVFPYARR